jgi:hypothetical protein
VDNRIFLKEDKMEIKLRSGIKEGRIEQIRNMKENSHRKARARCFLSSTKDERSTPSFQSGNVRIRKNKNKADKNK